MIGIVEGKELVIDKHFRIGKDKFYEDMLIMLAVKDGSSFNCIICGFDGEGLIIKIVIDKTYTSLIKVKWTLVNFIQKVEI